MRKWWGVAVFALLVALAVWMHALSGEPRRQPPPRLTAAEIAALPEIELCDRAVADLRWQLVNLPLPEMTRWRDFPTPARHLLALAEVVSEPERPPPRFEGFAALADSALPTAPTLVEVAAAFTAIGAAEEARVVQAAEQVRAGAGGAPRPVGAFAAQDQRLRALLAGGGAARQLRSYVRQNADAIAGAAIR